MPASTSQSLDAARTHEDAQHALAEARREIQELRAALAAQGTERQCIQQELDLRNAALDAASSHFMITDTQERIVYTNRALATQHGYANPRALIGQSVSLLLGQRVKDLDDVHRTLSAGKVARTEMQLTRLDGSNFLVGLTMTPLLNGQGEMTHYVTMGADITARREMERKKEELQQQLYSEMQERERMAIELRLAQKLESVGRLAAGLAHEINTPIQYVSDSVLFLRSAFGDLNVVFEAYRAALAASGADPAETARLKELEVTSDLEFLAQEVPKAFERTLEGAERVAAIVRAMKEFAYPDAVEQRPADLNHALSTTLTVSRGEYKYAASIDMQPGELPQVVCNVGELNQVFLNLIVNAAHAIHDSGKDASNGRITISTGTAGDMVQVIIADNGCGIPADNVEKIFDPFFTTKEVGRGTGQGLAIARSIIVDKHGGAIDVESVIGAGTRFIVKLPIAGRKQAGAA